MSKKDMLMLGVLAVGGIGAASMLSDSGDDGGGSVKTRPGGILGTTKSPTVYNFPAQEEVKFPAAPAFDISKFLAPEQVNRGAAGVSAAPKPKKLRAGAGSALGYEGYVTPKTPTPVLSGYVSGVTKFVPYQKSSYIPSPIKPPSVSYSSSKKSSSLSGGGGD